MQCNVMAMRKTANKYAKIASYYMIPSLILEIFIACWAVHFFLFMFSLATCRYVATLRSLIVPIVDCQSQNGKKPAIGANDFMNENPSQKQSPVQISNVLDRNSEKGGEGHVEAGNEDYANAQHRQNWLWLRNSLR